MAVGVGVAAPAASVATCAADRHRLYRRTIIEQPAIVERAGARAPRPGIGGAFIAGADHAGAQLTVHPALGRANALERIN